MKQYVYIVLDTVARLVKIGLSRSPEQRLKAFRRPSGLCMLAIIPGSRALELDIHKLFEQYRVVHGNRGGRTEWFTYNCHIAAFAKAHTLPLGSFAPPATFPLVLPADLRRAVKIAAARTGTAMYKLIIAAIEAEYPEAA